MLYANELFRYWIGESMRLNAEVVVRKGLLFCAFFVMVMVAGCGQFGSKPAPISNATPVVLPPKWTETVAVQKSPSPGWEVFTGEGVELWLPDSFEGGDPIQRREELIEMVRSLGPEYDSYLQAVESSPTGMVLVCFDLEVSGTIVGITKRDIPAELSLDQYLDGLSEALVTEIPGTSIVERSIKQFDRFDAGRLVIEFDTGEAVSRQLTYIVLEGGIVWTISYASPLDQFTELVPVFEESIASFKYSP
jgi:hypothetical protein